MLMEIMLLVGTGMLKVLGMGLRKLEAEGMLVGILVMCNMVGAVVEISAEVRLGVETFVGMLIQGQSVNRSTLNHRYLQ